MPGRRITEPSIPVKRLDTIRRYIISLLKEHTLSAKEMSLFLKISEKDVCDHLKHIKRTINKENIHLIMKPAQCERCGFEFRKRERFSKPTKCPICHSSLIYSPLFSIK